jgi:dTDP-4-amino-4,6-dideoxygalactose transaminase
MISGNGEFTKKCQSFFEQKYGFKKCLLTTSCTDALEMCAILADIGPSDEVIAPSYTFVSTALAFVRQGARIVFADSQGNHPNIDPDKIEALVTPRTKAVVVVHYAGVACDMDKIMRIAEKYNLIVIEDAAHAIDSFYKPAGSAPRALGGIGHLSAFSFHETKNIISGEGGMLAVNDARFIRRAEIIWEKGTNRAEFFRGEVNKYCWVDTGSSFLPSDIIAAFLWAQIECLESIQAKRKKIWDTYFERLAPLAGKGNFRLPEIPVYATNNMHIFYLVCNSQEDRAKLIGHLKQNEISAVFHCLSLHSSKFYADKHDGRGLKNCDKFADCLVRLPLFYELTPKDVEYVCDAVQRFYV